MNTLGKVTAAAVAGLGFALITLPANALVLNFNQIVTGSTPTTSEGGSYLLATITNTVGGVNINLDIRVSDPEFVTDVFFNLSGAHSGTEPATIPDIDLDTCSGNNPAGTGPWELCLSFSSAQSERAQSPANVTFFIAGITEDSFLPSGGGTGWSAVAHVQGIQPNCSGWVGAVEGGGTVQGSGTGACVPVPEPTSISLLGLGLAAMLGAGIANGRRRRNLVA